MIKNRSTKYNSEGEFWHDGREIYLKRIWGGLSFDGPVNALILVGEEQFFSETNYYILVECKTTRDERITDLLDMATRVQAEYKMTRWYANYDKNVRELLAICNSNYYSMGVRGLSIGEVPRIGEHIDENVSLIHKLTRPQEKRIFFFKESMVTSEILSLPDHNISAEKFPLATALSGVIASMIRYAPEDDTSTIPVPEGAF